MKAQYRIRVMATGSGIEDSFHIGYLKLSKIL
jgi:hypothetical protein